ncbi:Uncharacterised protein [Vibrio cholerae]|nr:Uncharacterised protein [Vibrio cholerae]CSB86065.1 Uncharacterised protein [Vibrio cholerae]CSC91413.1 Uncharacterised protein [Vibrio cholerae]CSD59838.1 Uncharacterised protein [Vibrio cholerae]
MAAEVSCACFSRSVTPIKETNAVSLSNTSHWFIKPGSAWRTACGSTIRINAWLGGIPNALAASRCPLPTALSAPRNVCEAYEAKISESAITPEINGLISINSPVMKNSTWVEPK